MKLEARLGRLGGQESDSDSDISSSDSDDGEPNPTTEHGRMRLTRRHRRARRARLRKRGEQEEQEAAAAAGGAAGGGVAHAAGGGSNAGSTPRMLVGRLGLGKSQSVLRLVAGAESMQGPCRPPPPSCPSSSCSLHQLRLFYCGCTYPPLA